MALRFIYFDLETTGVKTQLDKIIEVAAFDPEQQRQKSWLVNPECPIPPEATAIHNISDEMVKDAPTFKEVAQEFIAFTEGDVALVAHNGISFDKPFLEAELKRAQLDVPDWKHVDSLLWARKYRPDLPRHTLQSLREVYAIDANNAHRALDDVLILHKVFSRMIDDLSPEVIYRLLSIKQEITTMPFGKHQGKDLEKVPKDYISWLHKNGALDKGENEMLKKAFQKKGLLSV